MKFHTMATRTIVAATLGLPFIVGCGGSQSSSTMVAKEAESSRSQATPQSSDSPTVVAAGVETEPAQSVAIFLDSLRKGDERAANGVLTTLARQELAKTPYVIEPLGTPAGQYKIGRVGFPYAEKDIALVECTWTEPSTSGEPQETIEIVCEVHKEAEGWRISGIGVSMPGTEEPLVIDFEDAASLEATIAHATGQTAQQSTLPVNTGGTASRFTLPAFPTGSTTGLPSASDSLPQIALPPLNNAPVNR